MLIWFFAWLFVEILYFLTLTETQFDNSFESYKGVLQYILYIPLRFVIWPFLLVAIAVEFYEFWVGRNDLNVWWLRNNSFKL